MAMRVYVKNNKGYGKNMLIACMMADIAEVLSYLPTAIIVGAVYALVAGIVLRLIGKRAASSGNTPGKVPFGENSVFKLTMSTLLVIYIVVVLMTVFFLRELGSREGIDMRILGTWGITMQDHAWVIENVLLFIPLGLLLPFWFPTGRKGIVIIVGLVCSIGIEVTQLVTGYGIPAICRYCKYMSEDNGKKAMLFIAGDRVDDDDLSFFGTAGRRIRADESAVWNVDLSDGCTAF